MFHGFTDKEHSGCENCQHKHLHNTKFEAFLKHLKQHYQIISLDDLVRALEHNTALPKRAVVLTFDDGFLSNYTLAYPLLKQYQAPATIYLATEFVDESKPIWTDRIDYAFHAAGRSPTELKAAKSQLKKLPQEQIESAVTDWESKLQVETLDCLHLGTSPIYAPLSWDHILEMQSSGLITFGAHTHTHKILGRCQMDTVRAELALSKSIIEDRLGQQCDHFCYPNGSHGDFSQETEDCVREVGFRSSVTTLSGRLNNALHPFLMPRLGITNDLELARFKLITSGFIAWLENTRSKLKPSPVSRD
jgi:peptidoglycan/xylan/chitin deacetylase (PgdA/CDA1 family)